MTEDKYGLSRRQLLGGLGAIGVTSAGVGLGTTAYFSDDELFGRLW
ncbi:SipW-dependent-type signal peptide-containing protein [Natrinema sp. CBA1119]|nr:SipW-dependent-type signal peptide-containing protein [Natrinema sp. CBA1119]